MIKGEFIHLEDGEVGTVEECNAVFCIGFQSQRETDEMRLQVIFMGDDLTYGEFSAGLGAVIAKELIKTAKGNHGLELDMADKFISSFVGVLEKRAEEYEKE